jgi:hypothetical protein
MVGFLTQIPSVVGSGSGLIDHNMNCFFAEKTKSYDIE